MICRNIKNSWLIFIFGKLHLLIVSLRAFHDVFDDSSLDYWFMMNRSRKSIKRKQKRIYDEHLIHLKIFNLKLAFLKSWISPSIYVFLFVGVHTDRNFDGQVIEVWQVTTFIFPQRHYLSKEFMIISKDYQTDSYSFVIKHVRRINHKIPIVI